MKRIPIGIAAAAALAAALLPGCRKAGPALHLYTWADYIDPDLVREFEEENGCRVVIDTFDSNESMYAKLKSGATGYDVLVPSSYMVKIMREQGMLRELDHSLLPHLAAIDPDYLKIALDPGMDYSVPYMLTYTGAAYLKNRIEAVEQSWSVFGREDLKGRMTMLDDMRETIGAALKYLGYSLNTVNPEEVEAAGEVVIGWKKNLAKFENEQYKTGLASGEFLLVHGYSGDIVQVQEENGDIVFFLPREGFSISCDDLVIPAAAAEVELAHRFIDFLCRPEIAARNVEFIGYLAPNRDCYPLLSEEIRENPVIFPPEEVRRRGELIEDLGDRNALYIKVWDRIKAAP